MGTPNGASALSANETSDWIQAHAALSRLSRERAALDAEEGRWLLCAWRSAAHLHLGYGSFVQYIESLFGYKPRTTQEKLRVAEALETLPRLHSALEGGALSWCAARELTRVALPGTESTWLDAARGKTLREFEALVANRAPGDTPDAPATELPRPRVLRFEVAADTFATFREAVQHLQRSAGGRLDGDALLLALARHVLDGSRDEGRSSYQLSLHVRAVCGGGAQLAAGERVTIDATVVDMAECDAQHLGELLPLAAAPQAANENATPLADTDGREGAAHASGDECTAAHQRSSHAHMGAHDIRPRPRAKQSIPPALRRAVLARDRRRCCVPGCTHATFLDVHHVQPRAEGGRNDASNLLTLCGSHHRAVHRGELLIEREPDGAASRDNDRHKGHSREQTRVHFRERRSHQRQRSLSAGEATFRTQHGCRAAWQGPTQRAQFSVFSPDTRRNSFKLLLTSVAPVAMAWAAIIRSIPPIGVPFLSSSARMCP